MAMVALTKYHITWYMIEDVKAFLDQIRREWETNDDEILRIMQIHAFHGKRLVIIFAGFAYPSVCMVVLYHISPIILDKILPLNESRSIKYLISAEFFFNKEQHRIISTSLLNFGVITDVTVLVGMESFIIMVTSHIAGLFEVASLFFEKAVLAESSAPYLPRNCRNNETINYIITGTTVHRMALQ
nr:PREDICTED: uncharacterized protein LOC105662966 [Megachile rotundata]